MADSNAEFAQFLGDPTVPKEKKVEAMQDIMKSGKFSETTTNFYCKCGTIFHNAMFVPPIECGSNIILKLRSSSG